MKARLLAALAAGTVLFAGCGSDAAAPPEAASTEAASTDAASAEEQEAAQGLSSNAVITYAFQDSSVPPQYHRSFVLTVSSDESRIVVDSYGDVLADERVPTDPEVWRTLASGVGRVSSLTAVQSEPGCTGGTATVLEVIDGGQVLADLDLDACAGANAEAATAIDAWIAPARDQFPAMDVLAPEG